MMFKRGELTSAQIITLILSIGALVVLLGFAYLFFSGNDTLIDREACHLSVITRATAPSAAQSGVPLECRTSKICLSISGKKDSCNQFIGEEGVSYVKLPNNEEDAARVIMENSANAMFDCWSMTGQGKLDIFGKAFQSLGETKSSCIICSRVALSDEILEKFPGIRENIDFNRYLERNNPPGLSRTYLDIFTGESGTSTYSTVEENVFESELDKLAKARDTSPEVKEALGDLPTVSNQIAFIFAQRKTKLGFWDGALSGATLGSSAIVGIAVTVPGAKSVIASGGGALASLLFVGGTSGFAAVNSWQNQMASAAYCGTLASSLDNPEQGCSLVRGVDYDVKKINQICDIIEGMP